MAENTNYSQQAFHLSFKTAGKAADKKQVQSESPHNACHINEFLGTSEEERAQNRKNETIA